MSYTEEQKTAYKILKVAKEQAYQYRLAQTQLQAAVEILADIEFDVTDLQESLEKVTEARQAARVARDEARLAYTLTLGTSAQEDAAEED